MHQGGSHWLVPLPCCWSFYRVQRCSHRQKPSSFKTQRSRFPGRQADLILQAEKGQDEEVKQIRNEGWLVSSACSSLGGHMCCPHHARLWVPGRDSDSRGCPGRSRLFGNTPLTGIQLSRELQTCCCSMDNCSSHRDCMILHSTINKLNNNTHCNYNAKHRNGQ